MISPQNMAFWRQRKKLLDQEVLTRLYNEDFQHHNHHRSLKDRKHGELLIFEKSDTANVFHAIVYPGDAE